MFVKIPRTEWERLHRLLGQLGDRERGEREREREHVCVCEKECSFIGIIKKKRKTKEETRGVSKSARQGEIHTENTPH
jgi:hypothetical protein